MTPYGWVLLGASIASVLWLVAFARVLVALADARRALATAFAHVRLVRSQREESDRQVRELLIQNERLARQLIDRAAEASRAPVVTLPSNFFRPRVES